MAYVTAGILNYRALKKYTDVSLDVKSIFIKPLGAALIMGAAALICYKIVFMVTSSNSISTLLAIMFAAAVYFVAAFRTGAVTKEEIELIPKGDLLYRLAVKLKVAK
jgi:stage V sporulation protein B